MIYIIFSRKYINFYFPFNIISYFPVWLLSLYVSPVMSWTLIQGVPRCSPNGNWDWLQRRHHEKDKRFQAMMDGFSYVHNIHKYVV